MLHMIIEQTQQNSAGLLWSERFPHTRNLVQESDVCRQQAVCLVVVVGSDGRQFVFRRVKDAGIPGLLRQRVNRNPGNLPLGKLLRVTAADLVHIYTLNGYMQLTRERH